LAVLMKSLYVERVEQALIMMEFQTTIYFPSLLLHPGLVVLVNLALVVLVAVEEVPVHAYHRDLMSQVLELWGTSPNIQHKVV
uniref:hypothetical protein n=1 Tax=Salmonella sp. s51228 TaxID=3159652 RepID=UPI00397F6F16